MRTDGQAQGDRAERIVAERLRAAGWTILGRNLRAGRGELDLVGVDPGPPAGLVVVEVRWRSSRGFGLGEETIDHRKRAHLRTSLGRLLEDGHVGGIPLPHLPLRVDVVVVEPPARAGDAPRIRHHRAISL